MRGFNAVNGGGNFHFPKDQLLVVMTDGTYKPIATNTARLLGKLSASKNYLVWYHHLLPVKTHKDRLAGF